MDQATVATMVQRASSTPRQAWQVRLAKGTTRRWTRGLLLAAAESVPSAALWSVALWGRTTVQGMSMRWAATFFLTWLITFLWGIANWVSRDSAAATVEADERPAAAPQWWQSTIGLLPAALLSLLLFAGVYASEDVHHAFVHRPELKGIFLPLVLLLTLGVPIWQRVGEAAITAQPDRRIEAALAVGRVTLARYERSLVAIVLVASGFLHAFSFLGVATDDLIRYWAIADGLLSGNGYPVTTGEAGGGGFYLVELPVFPVLASTSFLLVGHRFIALMLPLALAHAALPLAFFLLARACGAGRLSALWLALIVVSFPQYQIYALGAPEPEPLLALWISLALYFTVRRLGGIAASRQRALLEWAGAGAFAALATLTRPEGILYAGSLFLGIGAYILYRLFRLRTSSLSPPHVWHILGGPAPAALVFALPVLGFVTFLSQAFGILWPTGWTNVAGPQFILGNYRLVLKQNLPHYAESSGLPSPVFWGQLIALVLCILLAVGLVRLCMLRPALSFIVLGLALNLAVIFVSPTYLTPDLFSPPTFFRHLSVLFPWCIPAGAALAVLVERWSRSTSRLGVAAVSAALLFVLIVELTVLGVATARDQAQIPTIFTQDPFVLMTDLWQANDDLPQLPFTRSGGRAIATIDPSFDYLAFRSRLFTAVRPYDLHFNDAGRAYVLAIGVFSIVGMSVLTWTRLGKRVQ